MSLSNGKRAGFKIFESTIFNGKIPSCDMIM